MSLYYYRQVNNSITKKSHDKRILAVIDSWDSCLQEVKKEYLEPMEAAIYSSICAFIRFKPEFAEEFLEYAQKNKQRFLQNDVILNWLKNKTYEDVFKKTLIPKKIHYFWFGGNPKRELVENCIASWKKFAPDFEIIEWNESNCDVKVNKYVEEAYSAKNGLL